MKSSNILIEKFERKSGIYIIFNVKNKKVYIGKANDLKRRMVEHVRNLFANRDNNVQLQEEFNRGGNSYRIGLLTYIEEELLDEYEGAYFMAAVQLYGRENVYNKIELRSEMEIPNAKENIMDALNRVDKMDGINVVENNKKGFQDWLEKSIDEIKNEAERRLIHLGKEDVANIEFGMKSVRELYENGDMDFLLLGKMGDYVGTKGRNQTFNEILVEKLADIALYKKCLWITSGPNIDEFQRLRSLNKHKKMYALFSLTINKFQNGLENIENTNNTFYLWNDESEKKYFATGLPSKKRKKALVIERLWAVKEDFIRSDFEKLYYHAESRIENNKMSLSKEIKELSRSTLIKAFSNNSILKREEIRAALKIEGDLFEEFKDERLCLEFPENSESIENNGTIYYILAEVSDYVYVESTMEEDVECVEYKQTHPYYA